MAFNMLVPANRKPKQITVSCAARQGGDHKLQINIPTTIYLSQLKDADALNVLIGEGADKGKVLLVPTEEGHFKPKRMKYTVMITLPHNEEFTPKMDFKPIEVERREQEDKSLLIELPTWADKDVWPKIRDARSGKVEAPSRVVPNSLR